MRKKRGSRNPSAAAQETLQELARREVGDDRSSLVFVTIDMKVRAVFTGGKKDHETAIWFAKGLAEPAAVEDKTGVVWDNYPPGDDE